MALKSWILRHLRFFGLVNTPQMTWAIGVSSETETSSALQSQVHDGGAEPGETIRIFGKNFLPTSDVVLESSKGTVFSTVPSEVDATSIAAQVPDTIEPGTYYAWVGGVPSSTTPSLVSIITVLPPSRMTITRVGCYTLVGNGTTDNTSILQSCDLPRFSQPIIAGVSPFKFVGEYISPPS